MVRKVNRKFFYEKDLNVNIWNNGRLKTRNSKNILVIKIALDVLLARFLFVKKNKILYKKRLYRYIKPLREFLPLPEKSFVIIPSQIATFKKKKRLYKYVMRRGKNFIKGGYAFIDHCIYILRQKKKKKLYVIFFF